MAGRGGRSACASHQGGKGEDKRRGLRYRHGGTFFGALRRGTRGPWKRLHP